MYSVYQETAILDSDLIEHCQIEGILDDFLSLVQIQASGNTMTLDKEE